MSLVQRVSLAKGKPCVRVPGIEIDDIIIRMDVWLHVWDFHYFCMPPKPKRSFERDNTDHTTSMSMESSSSNAQVETSNKKAKTETNNNSTANNNNNTVSNTNQDLWTLWVRFLNLEKVLLQINRQHFVYVLKEKMRQHPELDVGKR